MRGGVRRAPDGGSVFGGDGGIGELRRVASSPLHSAAAGGGGGGFCAGGALPSPASAGYGNHPTPPHAPPPLPLLPPPWLVPPSFVEPPATRSFFAVAPVPQATQATHAAAHAAQAAAVAHAQPGSAPPPPPASGRVEVVICRSGGGAAFWDDPSAAAVAASTAPPLSASRLRRIAALCAAPAAAAQSYGRGDASASGRNGGAHSSSLHNGGRWSSGRGGGGSSGTGGGGGGGGGDSWRSGGDNASWHSGASNAPGYRDAPPPMTWEQAIAGGLVVDGTGGGDGGGGGGGGDNAIGSGGAGAGLPPSGRHPPLREHALSTILSVDGTEHFGGGRSVRGSQPRDDAASAATPRSPRPPAPRGVFGWLFSSRCASKESAVDGAAGTQRASPPAPFAPSTSPRSSLSSSSFPHLPPSPASRFRLAAQLRAEVAFAVSLRHPRLVTVLGGALVPSSSSSSSSSSFSPFWCSPRRRCADLVLVMECMERGSLFDLLHAAPPSPPHNHGRRAPPPHARVFEPPLTLPVVLAILRDVADGVVFLHASNVLHNDLKSANVLIDGAYRAKISDFGMASSKAAARGGLVPGTPFWMAPELLVRVAAPRFRQIDALNHSSSSRLFLTHCAPTSAATRRPPPRRTCTRSVVRERFWAHIRALLSVHRFSFFLIYSPTPLLFP